MEAWSDQMKRRLLAQPGRLGGLGVPISTEMSDVKYDNSKLLTERLSNKVIQQGRNYEPDVKIKIPENWITATKLKRNQDSSKVETEDKSTT